MSALKTVKGQNNASFQTFESVSMLKRRLNHLCSETQKQPF